MSELKRALGLRDLIFLNVSCMVGLASLPQVAQFGLGSAILYVLAIIMFVIPCGLMIAELNARMPEEGGFYLWTKSAFGDFQGYLVAWCYWISNIMFLPAVMLVFSYSVLYILGEEYLPLNSSPWYNAVACLGLLWGAILLNIFGIDKAKWVQNVGGIATWGCMALLLGVGVLYILHGETDVQFTANEFLPDLTDISLLPFFAAAAFSFGGIEVAPILAGEIKDPRRTIQQAIFISAIIAGLLYIVGTLMVIIIVPHGSVGVINAVAQTFSMASSTLGAPWLTFVGAILVFFSVAGNFGGWLIGSSRIPFVVGLHHYLPASFGKIHPRYGSPYIALIVEGIALTLVFISSIAGDTIKEGYLVVYEMSIILYFIPFIYMFAALIWHSAKNTGGEGIISLFKSKRMVWLVAGLGIAITLASTIIACVPSREINNKGLYVIKVVGGCLVLIAAGLPMYFVRRRKVKEERLG